MDRYDEQDVERAVRQGLGTLADKMDKMVQVELEAQGNEDLQRAILHGFNEVIGSLPQLSTPIESIAASLREIALSLKTFEEILAQSGLVQQ